MNPSSSKSGWSYRLAQALTSSLGISETVLAGPLGESIATSIPLALLLRRRGLVDPGELLRISSQLAQLPSVNLYVDHPEANALSAVPAEIARSYHVIGYKLTGDSVILAFVEPPDRDDISSLEALLNKPVSAILADPEAIEKVIEAIYPKDNQSDLANIHPLKTVSSGGRSESISPYKDLIPEGYEQSSPTMVMAAIPKEAQTDANNPGTAQNGRKLKVISDTDRPSSPTESSLDALEELPLHIDDLLRETVAQGASDLHLTAQMPPCIRINGAIRPLTEYGRLSNQTIRDMVFGILPQTQQERFEAEHELDTSHSIPGVGRFRVNVSMQRGTVAVALRPIPHEIPDFDSLGIPESVKSFTELKRGLVLVTGPTGSGKSTTLASLVDIINRSKPLHIVTVEDPIEFLHNHRRSIVNQREVGQDTVSFAEALRRVLRQDPDVILIGELRDLESISIALTAAETGHLVFATLHTQDAPQTVDRLIDVFPPNQQDQIRIQLAASLEGVLTQQLVLRADGTGRVPACEVMMGTPAIRNLIRGSKTHQIYSLMQTGATYGMQTMDQSLAALVKAGIITEAQAFENCRSDEDLRNHLHS